MTSTRVQAPRLCRAGQRTMGISRASRPAAPFFVPSWCAEQFHFATDPGSEGMALFPQDLPFRKPSHHLHPSGSHVDRRDLALLVLPRTRACATCAKPPLVPPASILGYPGVSASPAKVPDHLPGYDEVVGGVLPSLLKPARESLHPNREGVSIIQRACSTPIPTCRRCETPEGRNGRRG